MKSKIILLVFALCLTMGAMAKSRNVKFRSLDAKEFARYIERENVMLVDVRTPEEYAAGHLPNVERNLDVRSATFLMIISRCPRISV